MKKTNTVTRKIQFRIFCEDKEQKNAYYNRLREISDLVMRMANTTATHLYIQNNLQELAYIKGVSELNTDGITPKEKQSAQKDLFNRINSELFNEGKGWSPNNRTYRILSEKYSSELKGLSDIMTNLNLQLCKTFKAESNEYFTGKRSLRTYRKDIPIPFSSDAIINITPTDDKKNYFFTLFKMPFVTYFGRDFSGNKMMFDRAKAGEYKLCNSTFQFTKGGKLILNAVFQFESAKENLNKKHVCDAYLDIDTPIILKHDKIEFNIGSKEEFLHHRIAIQGARRRLQIVAKNNNGGKGRKKKLALLDSLSEKEYNYIQNKQHNYSRQAVDFCVKNRIGSIILKYKQETPKPEDFDKWEKKNKKDWYEKHSTLLRNWSYHGLGTKLLYKCKSVGIDVFEETVLKDGRVKLMPYGITKKEKSETKKELELQCEV